MGIPGAQGVGADLAGEAGLHGKAVQDVETVVSGEATPVPVYEEIVLGMSGASRNARGLLKCRCAVVGRTRSRRVLRDRWTANAVQPATVRDKRNASMAAERVSAPPPDSPWDASER